MSDMINYDDFAVKHNAAFAAFQTIYEAKTPKPVKHAVDRSDWFVSVALMVMVIASVIVSGSRTVKEFSGADGVTFIGYAAFVMLEVTIVIFAFYITRMRAGNERMGEVVKLARIGVGLAFAVALVANVHATLKDAGVYTATGIDTIILLMVGISAPTLAYISGHILAVEWLRQSRRVVDVEREYQVAMAEWADGLTRSWASQQGKWGVKINVSNSIPSIPMEWNGTEQPARLPAHSTLGHSKVADAAQQVRDYISDNPDCISMNGVELAKLIGVGKSTVYNVLKEYRQ